ncbi:sulfatase-like hydrolase/transferase, partial [Vibrio parahaemolyticus]|nr:sulfatase-like hydrolase/transferase [Vibrio parahaemolyticus]
FLFYDSPHGYDFPDDFSPKYEPMLEAVNYLKLNNDTDPTEFFNRYKTSVRYVDSMAGKVLDTLEKNGDLERTLVIITGDHGQ